MAEEANMKPAPALTLNTNLDRTADRSPNEFLGRSLTIDLPDYFELPEATSPGFRQDQMCGSSIDQSIAFHGLARVQYIRDTNVGHNSSHGECALPLLLFKGCVYP